MNKEEAKHLAKVIDAYANNKPIQWLDDLGIWNDCKENEEMFFVNNPFNYRIKPEEKHIQLNYNYLTKHFKEFPCTFIIDTDNRVYNILGFNKEFIRLHNINTDSSFSITYKGLLNYKWLNTDKQCGILII